MVETNHITYESLLSGNKEWVAKTLKEDPNYFDRLAAGQKPPVLWIGCSDSRVPANQVTGTLPGEIFVHRNVANVIAHNDLNMLSVLDYAVNVLKVNHVIINGHYGCGGVAAAMSDKQFGLIDNWLRSIKDVYRLHKKEVDAIEDEEAKIRRMVDLNVIEGVHKLSATAIVQNAWAQGQDLQLHGWVLDLKTGLINDLKVTCSSNAAFDKVFKIA
ncbi:Carbonate dehydratase [Pseudopedobacter saltans DSM 12145]|uniref:Carbonic anhydrase 2 n=1 Tax=Pseudopedobacter saltans (strain ATCC 51119 / DSM 12145 / JCM 21818 / CCUG 39354 / LMG 10337 / NBRC 100064 / NCIMB 13643) TaxID=762903 RepID=F0S530_PSESL|nr:carbonic anhydrase [Pseudopedobacter saltans]ADY50947.1 Carbonate dehydratase [Pseudopedobacter saltans DSM 12145]